MAGFVTQEVVEVLDVTDSTAVVTQEVIEVLSQWSAVAVVTQMVIEVLHVYVAPVGEVGIIIKGE